MDGVMGALLDSTVGYKIPKTVRIRDRTLAAYACITTVCITVRFSCVCGEQGVFAFACACSGRNTGGRMLNSPFPSGVFLD